MSVVFVYLVHCTMLLYKDPKLSVLCICVVLKPAYSNCAIPQQACQARAQLELLILIELSAL